MSDHLKRSRAHPALQAFVLVFILAWFAIRDDGMLVLGWYLLILPLLAIFFVAQFGPRRGLQFGVVILATVLAFTKVAPNLGMSWLLLLVPWAGLFFFAHYGALIAGPDWFTLTVLASLWGTLAVVGEGWWWNAQFETPARTEWLRIAAADAPYWVPALVIFSTFYAWRALSPTWHAFPPAARAIAHGAATLGALAFPVALSAVKAINDEKPHGGAGIAVLYPDVVVSFALLGAAMRSPRAVTARSLRIALCSMAAVTLLAVLASSAGWLTPKWRAESFRQAYLWSLIDTSQCGLGLGALAIAWVLLALVAQPRRLTAKIGANVP